MDFWFACGPAVDARSFAPVALKGGLVSLFNLALAEGIDQGFRSEYRLRKTDEFSSVFAFRRSLRSVYFELLHRPNAGPGARLGTVVAKKLVRFSVHRNLVKRIVRESFRRCRNTLPAKDLVVRVRVKIERPDRLALRIDIEQLFQRLAA